MTDLYGAMVPSEVIYDLYADGLYPGPHDQFCLNPRHKGPCKKTDTPEYKRAVPHLRKVPAAPPDITDQQNRGKAINAGLAAARQRAELLADQLGLRGKDRQGANKAIGDYGRQLHARNTALQAAQRIHDQLQRTHDRAEAQNLQAQLRAKLTNMRRADAARKQLARELARQASGGRHGGRGKGKGGGQPSAEARQIIKSAGFALDPDEFEVSSVFAPLDPDLYALAALPAEIALYGLDPHAYCGLNEFCRNPLHPGPCKGWKHMLHSVAPGAYHAYERARVDRLNAARAERVKALQAAGQKVPKHLLKPITYAEIPKLPPGVDYKPPTPKEAEAALPATAKEIAGKIAQKHAQIQAVKISNGHKALIESAKALGANVNQPAAEKAAEKMHQAAAELHAGQKLSEHPQVANTIAMLAKKAATDAGLSKEQEHQIHEDLAAHVDQGIPEAPELVKSAAAEKIAKQLLETKQKAEKAKVAEKAVHQELTAQTLSHLKQSHDSLVKSPGSIDMALGKLKQIQGHEHTSEAQKATAGELIKKYEAAQGFQKMHASQLDLLKKINTANLPPDELAKSAEHLGKIANHVAATPAQAKLAKELQGKFAEAAKQPTPGELAAKLSHHATSNAAALEHAATLGPGTYGKLPSSVKEAVQVKLGAIALNGTPADKLKAFDAMNKLGIKGDDQSVAKALAVAGGHVQLAPSSKATFLAQVTPAAFDKLAPSQQHKILGAMEGLHAFHGSNPEVKQKLEDAYHQLSGSHLPGAGGKLEPDDHVGKLLEGVSPAGQEVAGFPPVPSHLSAGAKHAAAVANGSAPGAKLAKTHLKAYADLTSDEYHQLPEPYQKKIASDLDAAQAKFLDPKKKDQVVAIKEQLGIGHPGEAGGGAGAGGGTPIHVQETHNQVAKNVIDSIEAINMLAGSKELGPDIKATLVPGTAQMLAQGKYKPPQWDTVAAKFVEHNIDQHLPLTPSQKDALTAEVKAEMDAMSQVNGTKPPENGLLAKASYLASVQKAGGQVSPDAWSKLLEEYAPGASLNAKVAKQVAAVQALHKHADPEMPADVDPAELGLTLKTQYDKGNDALAEKVLEGHATTMAQAAWTNAMLDANLNNPSNDGSMIPDNIGDPIKALLKSAYLNSIKQGKTEPGGVAKLLPKVIADVKKKGDKPNLADFLDAYNHHLDALAAGMTSEPPHVKETTAKTVGTAAKIGGGTEIGHVSEANKAAILSGFKLQPKGAQLKDPASDAWDSLVALAHVYGGKQSIGPLSVTQVAKIVDEVHAKNLGVSNAGLLQKKIESWLATPEGAKYAKANAKAKKAIVDSLTGKVSVPGGGKLAAGQKVQKLAGPGKYDPKLNASDFPKITPSEARNLQDKHMQETGTPWTHDQLAALKSYTLASGSMNNFLRGKSHDPSPIVRQQVINAQAGMRPLQRNMLLYRRTGWDEFPPGYQSASSLRKLIGKSGYVNDAFTSTSTDGGFGKGNPVLIEIEAPAGTAGAWVDHISEFPGENEVLLGALTKFRVLSVTEGGGHTTVRVRVVTPK